MRVCGAKTRSGKPCAQKAMENGRCRMHGGKSTGAPIKHGRYSKFLPTRLAAKYEEALQDAELISVREEVAIVQTFIAETIESIDLDNCEAMWDTLTLLAKDYFDAKKEEDRDYAASQMCYAIQDGAKEWQKVRNLLGYIESKRRLAETESKRLKDIENTLTAKEANALVAALLGIINKRIPDPDVRAGVASDLAELVHRAA